MEAENTEISHRCSSGMCVQSSDLQLKQLFKSADVVELFINNINNSPKWSTTQIFCVSASVKTLLDSESIQITEPLDGLQLNLFIKNKQRCFNVTLFGLSFEAQDSSWSFLLLFLSSSVPSKQTTFNCFITQIENKLEANKPKSATATSLQYSRNSMFLMQDLITKLKV